MVKAIEIAKRYIYNLDISNGETIRTNCPSCNGYKTFTVTNNMGLLVWNCYKASCNVSGNLKVNLSAEDIKQIKDEVSPPISSSFELPEYVVPYDNRKELHDFCARWDIDPIKLDLYYDVKEDRVVFPIKDNNQIVDATGRALTNQSPKWKRYGNNNLPYHFGYGKTAVVVEDCVSAAVIGGSIYVGVAILGTSLSDEHKNFISQFSTAIIALDPDAMPKIFAFAKELRGYVKNIKVLRLKDDLKYFKEDDIMNLYNLTPKE